jgi:hypothetical protein
MTHQSFRLDLRRRLVSAVFAALILPSSFTSVAVIRFEDVTTAVGFNYVGRSWGAAWADVDTDGDPDLWVTNHISAPSLFLNQGDGTFQDVTKNWLSEDVYATLQEYDAHGAAWADFDNDGDPDLVQLVGADLEVTSGSLALNSAPSLFFVNQGGVLEERGAKFGLDIPDGRGRMPLWLDSDNNGWLDLYAPMGAILGTAPTALFEQTPLGFEDRIVAKGIATSIGRNYALLGDIDSVGGLELLIEENVRFPLQILKAESQPFLDIQPALDPAPVVGGLIQDVAIADLDGDLDNDLFFVHGEKNTDVVQAGANVLEGHLLIGGNVEPERGIRFATSGVVDFGLTFLKKYGWPLNQVYIGSGGVNPSGYQFELSALDAANQGLVAYTPGLDSGLYIGYDTTEQRWVFLFSSASAKVAIFVLTSTAPIDSFEAIGWDPAAQAGSDFYYVNSGSGFTDQTQALGIEVSTSARSIVAGDFDNDMDLDLYMVATGPVQNLPNLVFENQGDGSFVPVVDAGGASGTIDGRGDAVAMADYDGDGYLDLFVTNGKSRRPFEEDGPVQMFRNLGGSNHWIELDLEGVISNRDAIGARIELTAGGVTQLREQAAGVHARAQNHMRVHFGLGANTVIDNITIRWPSGITQQLENISVDRILQVVEDATPISSTPVVTAILDQAINEGEATGNVSFRVGNFGVAPESLIVTASSSNQALIPDAGLVFDGTGFNRTINITPAQNKNGGQATITLAASDGTSSVSTTVFNVVVTPVNDPPVANPDSVLVNEGGSVRINISENDEDIDDGVDAGSIEIVTVPQNGSVSINPNGSVDYLQTVAGASVDSFAYTIKDAAGTRSNTAEVDITIVPAAQVSDDALVFLGLDPAAPNGDTDGDGVTDEVEIGPDIDNPLDSDGDGLIDALEAGDDAGDASVVAGVPMENSVTLTLATTDGEQLSSVSVVEAADAPAGIIFPYGALSYTTSSQPAGNVTVRMSFSADLASDMALYKVDAAGNYIELPAALWKRISDTVVEITVTDGDPLTDSDGVVNGIIEDTLAVGSVTPAAAGTDASGGGGGGCTIASTGTDTGLPLMFLFSLLYLLRGRLICSTFRGS